jgi:hypothetical protein
VGRKNFGDKKSKTPYVNRCTEASWVMGWRFVGLLRSDRRLLGLPPNRFGSRLADAVGQIIDRSRIPEPALDQVSWHVAITESRYRVVPQVLIRVSRFWVFEEFVIRPWGHGDCPTREEVRSGLGTNPIYSDPEVCEAIVRSMGKARMTL